MSELKTNSTEEHYKTFLSRIFAPQFARLNYGKLDDTETINLRDAILGIAYYVKDPAVLDRLISFHQSDFSQIDPELRPHVLSAKFYQSEAEVFTAWLERYQSEADPELKQTLLNVIANETREPAHLKRLIELLCETDIVRPQDHTFLYAYLLRNHRTRQSAVEWLVKNWDFVKDLSGDKSLEDYVRYTANFIHTPTEAKIFYNFFDQKQDEPALARALKTARVAIDSRLKLIAEDTPGVAQKLEELTKGTHNA